LSIAGSMIFAMMSTEGAGRN